MPPRPEDRPVCLKCQNKRRPHTWMRWHLPDGTTLVLCNYCASDPDDMIRRPYLVTKPPAEGSE